MAFHRFTPVALLFAVLAWPSSAPAEPDLSTIARGDVVLDWNAILLEAVCCQNGVEQVRLAAITHLAMFEAVNAISRDYRPYLEAQRAEPEASAEAAAVAAAHGVLTHYLVEQTEALDAAREASLDDLPDGPRKQSGIAIGEAAAAALVLHREHDGAHQAEFYVPQSSRPGQWQLTATCPPQGGLFLHWRKLLPFGIRRADQFRFAPPPPLGSRRFAEDHAELREIGKADSEARPHDRSTVARFYAAVLAQAVWNPIARQIASARRQSLSDNARLFALLNMAMSDALVAVMDAKYHYVFWRPETAIRAGESDGNPETDADPAFLPFIATPCHPSYPSAHASASYAAREVLERLYGNQHHPLVLSSSLSPGVTLRYTRLGQVTRDIDDARIYGGIHFRFDQRAGAVQGTQVGAYVVTHQLEPASHARRRAR
jgi:hypothetical protein